MEEKEEKGKGFKWDEKVNKVRLIENKKNHMLFLHLYAKYEWR